jgi:hypothetical protein
VTVRTQQPQIRQPIVVPPTVNVVELQRDRRAVPPLTTAYLASGGLEPSFEQTSLEPTRLGESPLDQQLLKGGARDDGDARTRSPALPDEVGGIDAKLADARLQPTFGFPLGGPPIGRAPGRATEKSRRPSASRPRCNPEDAYPVVKQREGGNHPGRAPRSFAAPSRSCHRTGPYRARSGPAASCERCSRRAPTAHPCTSGFPSFQPRSSHRHPTMSPAGLIRRQSLCWISTLSM